MWRMMIEATKGHDRLPFASKSKDQHHETSREALETSVYWRKTREVEH